MAELRVISDRLPQMPGVPCRLVRWSEHTEGGELAACDVGLAPIPDDAWTRGKGAYRSIQYAAAGLPTVASPVGANREVVVPGETGFWATTPAEWRDALLRLAGTCHCAAVRGPLPGKRARQYDSAVVLSRYAEFLLQLLRERPRARA